MEFKNAHLTRQLDLIETAKLSKPIFIIGAGAIGSFVALQLAKMGAENITVVDPDTVSIENMSCQFFRHKDIGGNKAIALTHLVNEFTGSWLQPESGAWRPGSMRLKGIVICAVDSMEIRRQLFEECSKNPLVDYFIDGRMGAETALMYTMRPTVPEDQVSYAKTLYTDADAVQERCTAKSTIYTANLLSGLVVKSVKNCIMGQKYPRVVQWAIDNDMMLAFHPKCEAT